MGRNVPAAKARDDLYFRVSNPIGRTSNPLAMFITRKAEFSASHVCRLPSLSEDENRRLFGSGSNPNGHGHNYIVEVTVEGQPNPITGMIMDLKDLKQILEEEVVEPMDHRFLNHEVKPFDRIIPTAENVAAEIWRRMDGRLQDPAARLFRVRVFETPDLFVDIVRDGAGL